MSHQLRVGAEVPVGVLDAGVTEIGRQFRQTPLDILAVAIPLQQGSDCESMPQIVQSRALRIPRNEKPGLLQQLVESAVDATRDQRRSPSGHEKVSLNAAL